MKNILKANLWLLLTGVMMFAAASCGTQKKDSPESQMLVVERLQAQLSHHIENDSYSYDADYVIDVPLYGPKPLMDSLKVFLNKELFHAFDLSVDETNLSEKDLFQDDLTGLLDYYVGKFKPFENNIYNDYAFSLLLIAQTDSFVTYGLEFLHCGANCGSEFFCYTFSKTDGHLCEIISRDNLIRFVEANNWDYQPVFDDYSDHFSFGLLEDGVLGAEQEASNHHYVPWRVEVEEMLPYLSNDAQKLIQTQGDITKYDFRDWSLGRRIGEAETVDGDNVVLFQHLARWGFEEHEYEGDIVSEADMDEVFFDVTAYAIKDGKYVPSESEYKTLAFIGKTEDYLIRVDKIGDGYHYSAWKHKFNMDNEPDLVLNNGWFDDEYAAYIFENKGYRYWVQLINPYECSYRLLVYQGKELLLEQPMIGLVNAFENAYHSYISLGTVIGSDGAAIHLNECVQAIYGAHVSYDYFLVAWDKDFQPVGVFEKVTPNGEKYYQAWSDTISSYFHWMTINPDADYYDFNEEDNTLYCACGEDRFDVYQFDGTHFSFVRKDDGFWLHPSLREFEFNVGVCRTTDYLIRVDYMGDDTYRYAAWKNKTDWKDQSSKPDIIIGDGYLTRAHTGMSDFYYRFENKGYTYWCMGDWESLDVYHGEKLILRQEIEDCL